jgi:hypothetical protein
MSSWSAVTAAGRPPRRQAAGRRPQPVEGAFADQFALHLRGQGGHGEQQPVSQAGAVRPVYAGAHPGQDLQHDAAGVQLVLDENQQLLHRPGDPVRFVDHQRVAGLQPVQGAAQLRPLPAGARGLHHHLPAVRAGKRVELRLMVLPAGRHPRVPDPDPVVRLRGAGRRDGRGGLHAAHRPGNIPQLRRRHASFGTGFGTRRPAETAATDDR